MLEIDKIRARFPECSINILKEYARDFLKPEQKEKVPPNPPFTGEKEKELFEHPTKEKNSPKST